MKWGLIAPLTRVREELSLASCDVQVDGERITVTRDRCGGLISSCSEK